VCNLSRPCGKLPVEWRSRERAHRFPAFVAVGPMDVDVVILGGGLAGNLLARQLRGAVPSASIALFERDHEAGWKVGESTVEIASNYLVRKQKLSGYLYDQQLPKNGLRFFFDTPEKNTEFTAMSEVGSDHLPLFATFQLDRKRLETDLRKMNEAEGVAMHIGYTVRKVELGSNGARHTVVVRGDGEEKTVTARWVVDGSGRSNLISRMLDLRYDAEHPLASVWARYEDVTDMDTVGSAEWRGRVRHTARVLSTNHFCYPGYWIWFIPLGRGVTSLGVVGEKNIFREGIRTAEGFTKWLREHHAPASLLENAKLLDVGGYTQLAYATKQFYGDDRWALIGDAAAFTDPFYSPGSDFISMECDHVTDLIRRDFAGEEDWRERRQLYDAFMKFRFDATILLYQKQYPVLGNYDLMRLKWNFDIACYYNLWLDGYLKDTHLEPREIRSALRRKPWVIDALRTFRDLFSSLAHAKLADGSYYENNLGFYNDGTDLLYFQQEIGRPRKRREINARTQEVFDRVYKDALEIGGGRVGGERPMLELGSDALEDGSMA
jgi:flavin-dependent dehydrogenase